MMDTRTLRCGIDVSKWQPNIDWQKVKKSGIEFAIIRAGYGTHVDPKAHEHIKGALASGLHVGLYWFSYACSISQAEEEARSIRNVAWEYPIDYPLYWDWESDSERHFKMVTGNRPTLEDVDSMAVAFCEKIENLGYYAGIYANADDAAKYFREATRKRFAWWRATWTDKEPAQTPHEFSIWQYTSKGTVPGIGGNVDRDYSFKPFERIMAEHGLNSFAPINNYRARLTEGALKMAWYCHGARHGPGTMSLEELQKNKKINCAGFVHLATTYAGITSATKQINHTNSGTKGTTIDAYVKNHTCLKHGRWVEANCKYSMLPDSMKYGCIYVYDSNVAVAIRPGVIASCNNAAAQMSKGKGAYTKVCQTSGYNFTHYIKYVFVPDGVVVMNPHYNYKEDS